MELSLSHPLSDQVALKAEGRIPVYMPGGSRVVVGYATIANDGTINIQMYDTDDVSDLVDKLSLGAIKGVSFDYQAAEAELVVDPHCLDQWPECVDGEYNPNCCRFPKSCSPYRRNNG